ncbi:MAG: hypothetical protein NWF00_02255 [Candidatus Bathyarchaeota archaeon]|nr:hypothetical protein [Candidatus Bathyarchaeota archaeon]
MKLALSVSKKHMNRASGFTEELVFTVVDLDKASYPLNFVCLLPKRLEKDSKPNSKFLNIFGKESNQTAIKLLTSLLRRETDVAVKKEIEKRLKALQPMPTISAKCSSCGCVFEPKKLGMFLQKTCQKCRSKHKLA